MPDPGRRAGRESASGRPCVCVGGGRNLRCVSGQSGRQIHVLVPAAGAIGPDSGAPVSGAQLPQRFARARRQRNAPLTGESLARDSYGKSHELPPHKPSVERQACPKISPSPLPRQGVWAGCSQLSEHHTPISARLPVHFVCLQPAMPGFARPLTSVRLPWIHGRE